MTELCNKCKSELLHLKPGAGECVEICQTCSIAAAFDYIQGYKEDGWIDVKRRLPEQYDEVIISDGKMVTHSYFQDGSFVGREIAIHVTHWMPLPKPPGSM